MRQLKTDFVAGNGLKTLAQTEQEAIRSVLASLSGNLTKSAKSLGISLSTLKRKLRESQRAE
jgi:transcriptional regulator with PAS, ATPase and Fis domain